MDTTTTERDLELTYIAVNATSYSEVTREADRNDPWGRDDIRIYTTIENISVVNNATSVTKYAGPYFDLAVAFPVKKDTPYYLVYANYQTGDSFGHDDGMIQYIDLFQFKEAAEGCRKAAEKDHDAISFKYMNELLEYIECSKSWWGYFEHLNYIEIETVYLES